MAIRKPTISRYLDTRRVLESGRYTVRLRIEFHNGPTRAQHYYSTGVQLTSLEWEKLKEGNRMSDDLREKYKLILARESEAHDILDRDPWCSPANFEAFYTGKLTRSALVRSLFQEVIAKMKLNEQITSSLLYYHALEALMEYGGEGLTLNVIDPDWLEGFEEWFLKTPRLIKGRNKEKKMTRSVNTLAIYLRNLRAVFNIAVDRKIISRDLYPFGRSQYRIPTKSNVKRALSPAQKDLLLSAVPANRYEARALEVWSFSYYCYGMNLADMAYLKKPDNFRGDLMIYMRRKSSTNERLKEPQTVVLREEVLRILASKPRKGYVFEIIDDEMTAVERKKAITLWVATTNKYMQKLSDRIGLGKITTYTGRHTAAYMMKVAGIDAWRMKKAFGHASVRTTEKYGDSIDLEVMRQDSKVL